VSCAAEGPTILVVGCARALAESLERSLSWDPPGEVIAAGSADDLVAVVRDSRPDVVLIDWRHPEIFRLARGVGHEGPQPAVVAVDVEPTESEVIALAEAGVSAFVCRTRRFRISTRPSRRWCAERPLALRPLPGRCSDTSRPWRGWPTRWTSPRQRT